jgi:hypothetical protein
MDYAQRIAYDHAVDVITIRFMLEQIGNWLTIKTMIKKIGIYLLMLPLALNAQSKKDQIIQLNFKVDSLSNCLSVLRNESDSMINVLNKNLSLSRLQSDNLQVELQHVNDQLQKRTIELDSVRKSLELLNLSRKIFVFDTIHSSKTYTCYYYRSDFPHIISSMMDDSIRRDMNRLIKDMSFKVPAIMQNEDYKNFRRCEEGDYNHSTQLHDKHVTTQGCEWCQSDFYSQVFHIEQKNYLSIVMSVGYSAGGNWGHIGYNALNMKGNEVVTIPDNQTVRDIMLNEIEASLLKQPLIDLDGNPYPILNEIRSWDIGDLTFYFKDNTLRLIFNNGALGIYNQDFDVALPRLQRHLKM